jgi:hypothetical protein
MPDLLDVEETKLVGHGGCRLSAHRKGKVVTIRRNGFAKYTKRLVFSSDFVAWEFYAALQKR